MKDIKAEVNQILISNTLKENMQTILDDIPEMNSMVGFEHKHPHHHLDVWEHTLEVVNHLKDEDLETKMAGLLHDIGKPFSFQEEEVRHFHGHPEVSAQMSEQILMRLGYEKDFIRNVCYLVRMHDTVINPNYLDNTDEMIRKRLQLQYADAKAHHPDTIKKRIDLLNRIKEQLKQREEQER